MRSTTTILSSTPAPSRDAGIFGILKHEHRAVARLMEQISNEAPEARSATFELLFRALVPHSKGEEQTLYKQLLAAEPSREITLEAVQEHRVASALLTELRGMSSQGETWMAKFKVLQENVKHHVEEEETEMFPKAREVLSNDEAKEVARAYEIARDAQFAELGASHAR